MALRQSSMISRSTQWIRTFSSIPEQKRGRQKREENIFVDPNMKNIFEKVKKGDFIPEPIDFSHFQGKKLEEPIGFSNNKKDESAIGKLVYVGKLDKPFKAAKSLSLASSLGGAMCYPVMLPKILEEASIFVAIGYSIISATFVLLTPTLIQMISKRYLTSLYYHENTEQFTGYYKNFFMLERQIRFRAEDVEVPPITGMFTSMLIRNQPFFINHDDFDDKTLLKRMLGYDKEFDFSKYSKDISPDDDDEPVDPKFQKRTNEQKKSL